MDKIVLDIAGHEIKVGNTIATVTYGHTKLEIAKVVGFSDKKVRVIRENGNSCTKLPNQCAVVHQW